jgi:hypothetical protein
LKVLLLQLDGKLPNIALMRIAAHDRQGRGIFRLVGLRPHLRQPDLRAEAAAAIASVRYYDDDFRRRRIYTAWDNLRSKTASIARS